MSTEKEVKPVKKKFKHTKVGGILNKVLGGVVSEAASYIPIVGHTIATKVDENFKGDANVKSQQITVGRVILLVIVAALIFGFVDKEMFVFILDNVRNSGM